MTRHFHHNPWYHNHKCWSTGMAAVNYLHIEEFIYFILYPVIVLHGSGVWPLQDRFWVTCVILHFSQKCCANTYFIMCKLWFKCLNQLIEWFPHITQEGKEGRCESAWLNVYIYHIFCGDTIDRGLWHMVNGWFHVTYAKSFVECDNVWLYNWLQEHVTLICPWCCKLHQLHGCLDQVSSWCFDYW